MARLKRVHLGEVRAVTGCVGKTFCLFTTNQLVRLELGIPLFGLFFHGYVHGDVAMKINTFTTKEPLTATEVALYQPNTLVYVFYHDGFQADSARKDSAIQSIDLVTNTIVIGDEIEIDSGDMNHMIFWRKN